MHPEAALEELTLVNVRASSCAADPDSDISWPAALISAMVPERWFSNPQINVRAEMRLMPAACPRPVLRRF